MLTPEKATQYDIMVNKLNKARDEEITYQQKWS